MEIKSIEIKIHKYAPIWWGLAVVFAFFGHVFTATFLAALSAVRVSRNQAVLRELEKEREDAICSLLCASKRVIQELDRPIPARDLNVIRAYCDTYNLHYELLSNVNEKIQLVKRMR